MRHFSPQQKKGIIRFTGCILIPVLLFGTLLYFGIDSYNMTGLLNLKGYRVFFHVLCLILLIWVNWLLKQIMPREHLSIHILLPMNILILAALFIPYEEGRSLVNTLHITAAYLAFALFSVLLADMIRLRRKYLRIFLMSSILCLFLCLSAGRITGLAEALFGSIASILLALCAS